MPFNPDVPALFRLAYPSRAGTEIESVELPHPDERSAEELEEARWQTALMPVSHHRNLGVALYQPLLGGGVGFVDSASEENKARAVVAP